MNKIVILEEEITATDAKTGWDYSSAVGSEGALSWPGAQGLVGHESVC